MDNYNNIVCCLSHHQLEYFWFDIQSRKYIGYILFQHNYYHYIYEPQTSDDLSD